MITRRACVLCLGLVVAGALRAGAAVAEPRRFALLVGQATGAAGEARLRFAEADAQRVASVLRELGGFDAEDVVTMADTSAAEVRRALIRINARLRQVPGETLLFVFYSGHADAEALHLGGTELPSGELRDLVAGSPATARVLVVDACRSGGATRRKGGRRVAPFAIDADGLESRGVAILYSSAEGEDSQESDRLQASFFTHYLVSALRGAADADGDGRVTLVEAFSFASERTLAATARTLAGPQHPTYRFDLAGRDDLALTHPGATGGRSGTLRFVEPGAYMVQAKGASGPVVAELSVDDLAKVLALPPGEYVVTRRARDHLLQGRFAVATATATAVAGAAMERTAYAQVVRKGGTALWRTTSAVVSAGARGGHGALAVGPRMAVGARVDLPSVSLEARLAGGWSRGAPVVGSAPEKSVQSGRELAVTGLALRAFDVGHTSLAVGFVLGGLWVEQELGTDPLLGRRSVRAVIAGGAAQAQRDLFGPLYVRGEVSGLAHVYSEDPTSLLWTAELAVGVYF